MTSTMTLQSEPLVEETTKTERKHHHCPKCKISMDYRVHRGFLIKALFPNTVKRYLCTRCMHKYYVLS
jgi:transposase-like protein